MTNTASFLPSEVGTLAKENGCCSYRNRATVGMVTSLDDVNEREIQVMG